MQHYLAHRIVWNWSRSIFIFTHSIGFRHFDLVSAAFFTDHCRLLVTEISPRENSATSEAKLKRRDKITVFTLLALTGIVTGTMPAAVLTTVPLTIVFFFTQRYIFESEVVSGLKG